MQISDECRVPTVCGYVRMIVINIIIDETSTSIVSGAQLSQTASDETKLLVLTMRTSVVGGECDGHMGEIVFLSLGMTGIP